MFSAKKLSAGTGTYRAYPDVILVYASIHFDIQMDPGVAPG